MTLIIFNRRNRKSIVVVSLTNKYINYENNEINSVMFEPFFSQSFDIRPIERETS